MTKLLGLCCVLLWYIIILFIYYIFRYLDRQDFLERSDMKQFELERDLRMSRRSNR